jgi:membrane associated rhomboid family serine protease
MPSRITPVVLNLLILNGLVFVAWLFIGEGYDYFMYHYFLLFKSDLILPREDGGMLFQPLQIVTHFFSHQEIWHILMNMFGLVSIGTSLESTIGPKRFLAEYLTYGICAGIVIAFLDPSGMPVLGASAAVSGLFVSFALRFPDARMMIFPFPVPIKAIYLVGGIAGISAILITLQILQPGSKVGGNISHFGHFAGMLVAFIYLKGWQKHYWQRNRWR